MSNPLHTDIGAEMRREDAQYRRLEALMTSYEMTEDAKTQGDILSRARRLASKFNCEIIVDNGRLVFKTGRAQ